MMTYRSETIYHPVSDLGIRDLSLIRTPGPTVIVASLGIIRAGDLEDSPFDSRKFLLFTLTPL